MSADSNNALRSWIAIFVAIMCAVAMLTACSSAWPAHQAHGDTEGACK